MPGITPPGRRQWYSSLQSGDTGIQMKREKWPCKISVFFLHFFPWQSHINVNKPLTNLTKTDFGQIGL